jgi:hypothetical protein
MAGRVPICNLKRLSKSVCMKGVMRILNGESRGVLVFLAASLALIAPSALGQPTIHPSQVETAQKKYLALSLGNGLEKGSDEKILNRYGVPFLDGVLPLQPGGTAEISVGGRVSRIFLLGMTDANAVTTTAADQRNYSLHSGSGARTIPPYGWADPLDSSFRFFVGDELGRIRLNYADGTTQVFPLLLGEGVWWGRAFYDFQEPFSTDARLRQTFAASLRLYPPAPVEDGNYIAVMAPKPGLIRSIVVENSPAKKGTLVIRGITVESADTNGIPGATTVSVGAFSPEFEEFSKTKTLRPLGEDETQTQKRLNDLRRALYTSDEEFKRHVAASAPPGYRGPEVSFQGNIFAEILANAFRYNLQDISNKIDQDGMYHTSTKDAVSWGGYRGFGTFRKDVGGYYGVSYTRDMGRSLQEITALGYTDLAERNADYSLRMARRYTTNTALQFKGVSLPPHWGDLVNRPRNPSFENDGQGLTILALYKLWQRLPDRDAWLRAQWPDIKAAGDWILWQFAHPEISGARNGLLHTTGESANGDGYSVYPDTVCMLALQALARMADSIGETSSAKQWRDRSDQMREAITSQYIVSDAKYGPVWTLDYANWTHKGSVLGPLIFQADYQGFAPEDSNPQWRAANEAAYQRLIDTYRPFGFYGQSMGYGQGFVTQSALLLDRMRDATQMLDWAAKEIYDPRNGSFVVPEGVQIDPTGRFWYRIGDLGNGVQEGEIVKTLRIVMGVDDTQPDRLQFFPRMPYDWNEIAVERYPIVFESSGQLETAFLNYTLKRSGDAMDLRISSDKDLGSVVMRLGPFAKQPEAPSVRVNGKSPAGTSVEHSGDSWWIRFLIPVRQVPNTNK